MWKRSVFCLNKNKIGARKGIKQRVSGGLLKASRPLVHPFFVTWTIVLTTDKGIGVAECQLF